MVWGSYKNFVRTWYLFFYFAILGYRSVWVVKERSNEVVVFVVEFLSLEELWANGEKMSDCVVCVEVRAGICLTIVGAVVVGLH